MEPCLTISFSCDYKDRWKDTMRKKLSFFLSGLLTSLALFALGVYLSIAETTVSIGTPLMLIGVLGILISPFAALFQKSGNKGFTGNLRILFYKNGAHKFMITIFSERERVKPLKAKNRFSKLK